MGVSDRMCVKFGFNCPKCLNPFNPFYSYLGDGKQIGVISVKNGSFLLNSSVLLICFAIIFIYNK